LADPEVRAKMSAARNRALADPEVRAKMSKPRQRRGNIIVPHWVPQDLWSEFFEIAQSIGEEAAASHIRRLKREMVGARG
jgi:hypothetical protein